MDEQNLPELMPEAPALAEEPKLGIRELIDKMIKQQDELILQKKEKKWRLPFRAKVNKAAAKKGVATFCVIKDNKQVSFIKAIIEDGTVKIDGVPRIATADFCLTYNNSPFYIINTASLRPYSIADDLKTADELKVGAIAGRRLILSKLEREAIKPTKKGMGGIMGWIILGAIIIGVGWYLIKGGF